MKMLFSFGNTIVLLLLAYGCIISADPKVTNVSVQAGDTITFAVQLVPASAGVQWYLDGKPLAGETGTSFSYSAVKGDFGFHRISVVETSALDYDSKSWRIAVSYLGWGTEELIESGTADADRPQIACSAAGFCMVVWKQDSDLYANRYEAEFGWGMEEIIESGASSVYYPQIACDAEGNAIAVWRQHDGIANSIYANRYEAMIGWSTEELIESSERHAYDPQVAFDADGNATVVWEQSDGTETSIYANRYVPGLGWDTGVLVESGDGYASDPQVACDAEGNAIAVWVQHDGTTTSIYANRYVVGVGWGTEELIESGTGYVYHPQIACDAEGNAITVWEQDDDPNDSIYANRYVTGVGWQTEEIIESGNGRVYWPQIAFDGGGNAIAVWAQHDGTEYSIYANRYEALAGWGVEELIECGSKSASNPQITFDAAGDAFAVWEQNYSIYSNHYFAGTGWGTEELIECGDGGVSYAQIACDATGNTVAVWRQYDGADYSIYANCYMLYLP